MSEKNRTVPIVVGLLSVLLIGVIGMSLCYPREWKTIQLGDSPSDVKRKCPGVQSGLQDIKGDFLAEDRGLVRWSLQVLYGPNNQATNAHLSLYIGTKTFFKRFYRGDLLKSKETSAR